MREHSPTLRPDAEDGPGGRAESLLVWLCVLTPVLVTATATFLDGAVLIEDASQNLVWASNGNRAQLVTYASLLLLVLLSVHLILSNLRNLARIPSWFLAAAIASLVGGMYRVGQTSVQTLVMSVAACLVLAAAGTVRVTPRMVRGIAWILGGVSLTSLLHSLAQPSLAMTECRDDKCGVFGGLLHAYFPHENVLGLTIVFLLPALGALRHHTVRLIIAILALVTVAGSGSRTAIAAASLGIAATWLVHRWQEAKAGDAVPGRQGLVSLFVGYFPLLTFIVSAVMVFVLSPEGLTGRGTVYQIVRENLAEHPFLGPGSEILLRTYEQSGSAWLIVHEHSQAGHLLAIGGALGFAFMLVALVRMGMTISRSLAPVAGAFALAPALGFVSEPTWELSPRSPYFWTMVITVAMLKGASRPTEAEAEASGDPGLTEATSAGPPRPSRPEATGSSRSAAVRRSASGPYRAT